MANLALIPNDVAGWPDIHGFAHTSGGNEEEREEHDEHEGEIGGNSWANQRGITSKTCNDSHPTTTFKREAFGSRNQSQSYSY